RPGPIIPWMRPSLTLWAALLGAPAGAAESAGPPAAGEAPPVRIGEGTLLLYKGTLKVIRRPMDEDPEEISVSREVGYLVLGEAPGERPGAAPGRRMLLLRSGEPPDREGPTSCGAVSVLAAPDLTVRAELPAEDRARRVSPFAFSHLPLG